MDFAIIKPRAIINVFTYTCVSPDSKCGLENYLTVCNFQYWYHNRK